MLPKLKKLKSPIYLDYAATTPVDRKVVKAMSKFWSKSFGNPSSLYKQGRDAKYVVDEARNKVATIIGAKSSEIVFTAGGTESCNLAVFGVARKYFGSKKFSAKAPHIIVSSIEHQAVLAPVKGLMGEGVEVTFLSTDEKGLVDPKKIGQAIRPETILVSIMYANNEIGTIEPVEEIGKVLRQINSSRQQKKLSKIFFHTDACQAAGSLDLNVNKLGVDLMSVNGSKIYGPKQTGFLFVRNGLDLKPLIYGGGQEQSLRSGTENVAGIVGLAKALEISQQLRGTEVKKLAALQQYFISKLLKISGVKLNGPGVDGGVMRLVNNINISISGVSGEDLMLYLDGYDIAVSTGSACTTGQPDPSRVLLAIGQTLSQASSAIRITLGRQTTKHDIDYALKVIKSLIAQFREVNNFLL